MSEKPTSIAELLFEQRDIEIFKIRDTKTRIATVQNYFFPRLEILLRDTLQLIQSIYGVNPYERMTFVYKPSNRPSARDNLDFKTVHIGLSAKRGRDRSLKIIRTDGKPFSFHPTYLTYTIDFQGGMCVELLPFRQNVDDAFKTAVGNLVKDHVQMLSPVLAINHICHSSASEFLNLEQAFTLESLNRFGILLYSPTHRFPVSSGRALRTLQHAFVAVYPLLDSFISIGEGEPPRLAEMISKLREWYSSDDLQPHKPTPPQNEDDLINLPELDSYSFVRAGVWWQVLARDRWKCCSCGRSAEQDGVTLEVDHITPRSLGGNDDIANLQTLCKKCNVGKSNKDTTDLRSRLARECANLSKAEEQALADESFVGEVNE